MVDVMLTAAGSVLREALAEVRSDVVTVGILEVLISDNSETLLVLLAEPSEVNRFVSFNFAE
jgi:hypothetical protein